MDFNLTEIHAVNVVFTKPQDKLAQYNLLVITAVLKIYFWI